MYKKKERLWIVSELFPPEETSTAYIMGELAKAFSSKYSVGVICGPEVYDKDRIYPSIKDSNKFDIFRTNTPSFNKNTLIGKFLSFITTSYSLLRLIKTHVREGDKMLMVTNPAPLVLLISNFRRRLNFEWNILVHDVSPENILAADIKIPFYKKIRGLFDKAYSSADRLIVLGRDMAELLHHKTVGKVPIHIIENWGDFDTIRPIEMPTCDRIVLEYAGNIGRVQGLEKIINELPDEIDFHIYGSGALENKLKDIGKNNVYFHGPFRRTDQTKILGACHISLVTLNDKMYGLGTPSKTYNIMASGRPILFIGPPNSEIGRLVREKHIGYCGWPNRWDIQELIIMGSDSRKIGEQYYSKSVILNKFLKTI